MNFHPSVNSKDETIYLTIHLHPKSSKQKISISQDYFEVFVKAPPIKGKANLKLLKVLAKFLGVSTSSLSIVKGTRSKIKVIQIKNVKLEELKLLFSQKN